MVRSIRNIVVGVAGATDDPVLDSAIRLAGQLGATLHVVRAFEIPHPIMATYSRFGWLESSITERFGAELLEALQERVDALALEQPIRCRAVSGPAHEVICTSAEAVEADLVVVGATRQGPMMRHILGSTADRVIRSASVPVLVLRPPFNAAARRVLLTTDLSPLSAAVCRRGAEMARALAVPQEPELRCLRVTGNEAKPALLGKDRQLGLAKEEEKRFLAETGLAEQDVEPRVRMGDPSKEIVAEAVEWAADLVVVGTQGRSGPARYILGSVAASVLRSALSTVLVIPAGAIESLRRTDGESGGRRRANGAYGGLATAGTP